MTCLSWQGFQYRQILQMWPPPSTLAKYVLGATSKFSVLLSRDTVSQLSAISVRLSV